MYSSGVNDQDGCDIRGSYANGWVCVVRSGGVETTWPVGYAVDLKAITVGLLHSPNGVKFYFTNPTTGVVTNSGWITTNIPSNYYVYIAPQVSIDNSGTAAGRRLALFGWNAYIINQDI